MAIDSQVRVSTADPVAVLEAREPAVSVVIPFTRPDKVGGAIRSILAQHYPHHLLEIIVVGAGSGSLLEKWPDIIAIDGGPIAEPGRARNLGAARATGEVLLFLDDDCEARPGWIENNIAALRQEGVGAVSGMIVGMSRAFFSRSVDYANFGLCQTSHEREGRLWTASFGIRSSLFKAVGGFDERIRVQEDIELCFRLMRRGFKTVSQPQIRVLHNHDRRSLKDLLAYQFYGGRQAGLSVEANYADLSLRNRVLARAQNPLLYTLLMLPFAVVGTAATLFENWREHKDVVLHLPFILLGKISCHIGIWCWCWDQWFRQSPSRQGLRSLIEYSLIKKRFRSPRILTLFVTSRCNARCGHCFYADRMNHFDDLTYREIEALSEQIGKLDKLFISGGEPFLRKDLPEVCRLFIKNNGVGSISIPTNGLLPEVTRNQLERILEISDGRPVTIGFSADGLAQTHDRMRGVPGCFQKLKETYHLCRDLQRRHPTLILRIISTVTRDNNNSLKALFQDLSQVFPGMNSPCLNLLRGHPADASQKLPSQGVIRSLYRLLVRSNPGKQTWLRKLADRLNMAISFETLRARRQVVPCEAGRILGVVEHNGDVKPCELLPALGNI
ncbi:MAG: glycosyltransferase, partial [Anaerolineales bacterium]